MKGHMCRPDIVVLEGGYPMNLKKNVGDKEKMIRMIAGAVLVVLFLIIGSGIRWLFLLLGLIGLATGFLGSCPIYTLLGKNTRDS